MSAGGISPRLTIPEDFTRASPAYRLHAWVALLGLLVFVALYVGLASWFTYTAYRMIAGIFAGGDGAVAGFFAAVPSGFLAIFMWKALFFIRHGSVKPGIEITAIDEPQLFAFLHELADEIGAPRPHRVFVSPDVNASVFYDLSILNFILPSRKNLIIGLGLVNSLNRSEFKAVLAHEFGHFAQRSMAVGRWVYIGEQIAGHIIAKRDILDKALDFISAIDLRVAWIGWIMRTVVWSIRSLTETVFKWVIVAQRALSREMEFQADLVAVSVTGSDALIHALYRLQPADEDWERSLQFANTQLNKSRVVTDLFAVQTRIGEHMRRILNEPLHGLTPKLPVTNAASNRLFTEQIAQPPRMWSTHPPNTEREANAKRTYIPSPFDDEPAWTLFQNPNQTREAVTKFIFDEVKFAEQPTTMSLYDAVAALDEQFTQESYDPRYQGAYLGRSLTIGVSEANQLLGEPPAREEIAAALDQLYPDSLHELLTQWRNLAEEIALLVAVQDGIYDASGGAIQHRGESIHRKQLPRLITQLEQERDAVLARIEEHDRQCRTAHNAAARYDAHGWQDYLTSLTQLLHYAEHSEADLNDAHGQLANLTSMAVATGRVSSGKLSRLIVAANDLQSVMARLDKQAESVGLPPSVLAELELASWREAFQKLDLPPANQEIISEWMNVIDSWSIPMREKFAALSGAVLDELLKSERRVANMYRGEEERQQAPKCAAVPEKYAKRPRGSERPRQKKLDWWSRFTLADGTAPAILRFAVAATIVAAVVIAGAFVGNAKIIVYNGLAAPVDVHVNGRQLSVDPFQHESLSVGAKLHGKIETRSADGRQIESFEVSLDRGFANYVYNVAGAAPMIEWTMVYGNASPREPRMLGCPRWRTTGADHIFTEPPRQIETSSSGGTRTVLSSYPKMRPYQILDMIDDPAERERVVRMHAEWDSSSGRFILFWMMQALKFDGFPEILSRRLEAEPNDVMLLRIQQDTATPESKDDVLKRHRELARQHPDDADWQYIAARAMPRGPEQDAAFLNGQRKWPNSIWFNNAVGYLHARQAKWQDALASYALPLKQRGPLFELSAIQAARIRRLVSLDGQANLTDLRESAELDSQLILESGQDLDGTPVHAYSRLNRGEVAHAYQVAGGSEADHHILVLIAASKGARREWQQKVLEIPATEITNPTLHYYLTALAVRSQQPYDLYLEQLDLHYTGERQAPVNLIRKLIEQGPPDDSFEAELIGLEPQERGIVLATAIVMYPEDVPDAWRESARRLLFATERPFF